MSAVARDASGSPAPAAPVDNRGRATAPGQDQAAAVAPRGVNPETPPAVDLERLADKVYQLMLADVRLTRARDGR